MCLQALKITSSPSNCTSLWAPFQQLSQWHLSQRRTRQSVFNKKIISYQDYFPIRKNQKITLTAFKSSALQVCVKITLLPSPQLVHKLIWTFLMQGTETFSRQESYLNSKMVQQVPSLPSLSFLLPGAGDNTWPVEKSHQEEEVSKVLSGAQCHCSEVITKDKPLYWKNKADVPFFTTLPIIRGRSISSLRCSTRA